MKKNDNLISVSLYFRGDHLNPENVSQNLNLSPSSSQRKGEKKITKTNEYVSKIGVWELGVDCDSQKLSAHIDKLTTMVRKDSILSQDIQGVEESYVDVFIATDSDEDGEGTIEFELSEENISALARWKVPVRFTVAVVKE